MFKNRENINIPPQLDFLHEDDEMMEPLERVGTQLGPLLQPGSKQQLLSMMAGRIWRHHVQLHTGELALFGLSLTEKVDKCT